MKHLGLTRAQERLFERALASHHAVTIEVRVLDQDGGEVTVLRPGDLISGQVNLSDSADQTRYLQAVVDARRTFAFEADGDWSGTLNFNREIQVTYVVKAPGLDAIEVDVFTGPVVDFDRTADGLQVEAGGREWYAQGNVERPYTIKKGTPTLDAIRSIMRRCGEHRFDFPDIQTKLVKDVSLDRASVSWDVAQKLARSINRHLFYDGSGRLRMRAHPKKAVIVFKDGDGGMLASQPSVSPSMEGFANRVIVIGADKKQAKQRDGTAADPDKKQKADPARGIATAGRAHPMSPWNLGRLVDGVKVPRFVDHREDNSDIRTDKAAHDLAEQLLAQKLAQTVEWRFEAFPVPHLELGDWFKFATRDGNGHGRLREATLPLDMGENMTVNYRARKSRGQRRATAVMVPRPKPVAERLPR